MDPDSGYWRLAYQTDGTWHPGAPLAKGREGGEAGTAVRASQGRLSALRIFL